MQAITRKITPRTTRPERIDILPSPALANGRHLRPADTKFQAAVRALRGCHDVARVGADAPLWDRYGRVDMDAFGRIIDERTFELLLVTGGALVMGLLTLIYLI